jgi:hypothetical protein
MSTNRTAHVVHAARVRSGVALSGVAREPHARAIHLWIGSLALSLCCSAVARDTSELQKRASWNPPTKEQVQQQLEKWLTEIQADAAARQRVAAIWSAPDDGGGDAGLLDRTIGAIAAADSRAREWLSVLNMNGSSEPARTPVVFDDQQPEFVRHNFRLAYGRSLAQQSHFDEALEQLSGLTPQQVVDPAALLFYQAVSYHRLLKKEECLTTLAKLLENEKVLPRRFSTVAKLMEADIRPLETDSLDEIARLMSDIRRRLNFGHAGKRVRQQEDDVIAKLDKMIKQIEEQLQNMPSAGQGQGQGNNQPNNPAQDSQNLGGRGAGDVDQKRIGSKSGWGNMPPKEREQALQQISKDLPAHYREAIEEYFRKLAREGAN